MTGRAEIYKVVPGVTVNAGRGVGASASLSLVPECGAVRVAVGVPASALRPAGRAARRREGRRSRRHGPASLGRPFARQSCGARGGGCLRRGLRGTRRGSPGAPPLARPGRVVSFWKHRPRGGVGTLGPPGGWCLRFFLVSSLPCAGALWSFAHLEPNSEVRSSPVLAFPVCVLGGDWNSGQRGEPSKARGNRVGVPVAVQCIV